MAFLVPMIAYAGSAIGGLFASGAAGTAAAGTAAAGTAAAGTAAAGTAAAGTAAAGTAAAGTAAAGTAAGGSTLASMMSSGTLMQGAGLALSAMGQTSSANQQAEIMRSNADAAEREAIAKTEAGKRDSLKLSQERNKLLGEQTVAFAKGGVSLTGSPLEVMAQTARDYERDILSTGYNADVGASQSSNEAQFLRKMAGQKKQGGWLGAGSSLITGLGSNNKFMSWLTSKSS